LTNAAPALPFDAGQAHDFAIAVASVVPILLLAALAVPALRPRAIGGRRAFVDLLMVATLLGVAALAEAASMTGIVVGVARPDVHLLAWLVVLTGVLTAQRLIAGSVRNYAEDQKIPEGRIWAVLSAVAVAVFLLALFLSDR
jgi:hypothetical protein